MWVVIKSITSSWSVDNMSKSSSSLGIHCLNKTGQVIVVIVALTNSHCFDLANIETIVHRLLSICGNRSVSLLNIYIELNNNNSCHIELWCTSYYNSSLLNTKKNIWFFNDGLEFWYISSWFFWIFLCTMYNNFYKSRRNVLCIIYKFAMVHI